jgi:hypothetical protein
MLHTSNLSITQSVQCSRLKPFVVPSTQPPNGAHQPRAAGCASAACRYRYSGLTSLVLPWTGDSLQSSVVRRAWTMPLGVTNVHACAATTLLTTASHPRYGCRASTTPPMMSERMTLLSRFRCAAARMFPTHTGLYFPTRSKVYGTVCGFGRHRLVGHHA